jgi:hypothetical protein
MWGGWGIYSPNHQKWPLGGCLSHGAPDSPVRQPCQPAVGFWPLELWLVGPLGCPMVHRTGPVDCPVRLLRVLCPLRTQARIKCVAVDRCVRSSRCSAGTPDSLVCHRTVRWIIAERPPISRRWGVQCRVPWCTGQSGAPDQGAFWDVFSSLYLNPSLVFLLACCEPLAPVKLID